MQPRPGPARPCWPRPRGHSRDPADPTVCSALRDTLHSFVGRAGTCCAAPTALRIALRAHAHTRTPTHTDTHARACSCEGRGWTGRGGVAPPDGRRKCMPPPPSSPRCRTAGPLLSSSRLPASPPLIHHVIRPGVTSVSRLTKKDNHKTDRRKVSQNGRGLEMFWLVVSGRLKKSTPR